MNRSVANYPAWPTVPWIVGEAKLYLVITLFSGGAFLLAAGLIYSVGWAIFVVGLLTGAAAALLPTLKSAPRVFSWTGWRINRANDFSGPQRSQDSTGTYEIRDELQKLFESATRIAAENEALRADIAQLRQRALRQRPGATL